MGLEPSAQNPQAPHPEQNPPGSEWPVEEGNKAFEEAVSSFLKEKTEFRVLPRPTNTNNGLGKVLKNLNRVKIAKVEGHGSGNPIVIVSEPNYVYTLTTRKDGQVQCQELFPVQHYPVDTSVSYYDEKKKILSIISSAAEFRHFQLSDNGALTEVQSHDFNPPKVPHRDKAGGSALQLTALLDILPDTFTDKDTIVESTILLSADESWIAFCCGDKQERTPQNYRTFQRTGFVFNRMTQKITTLPLVLEFFFSGDSHFLTSIPVRPSPRAGSNVTDRVRLFALADGIQEGDVRFIPEARELKVMPIGMKSPALIIATHFHPDTFQKYYELYECPTDNAFFHAIQGG